MKPNLRLLTSYGLALTAAVALSGCKDAGAVLAEESGKFAVCILDQASNCQVEAPSGTKVEKASVTTTNDAVRVLGTVKSKSECESYSAHSKSRSPKHIAQAAINNTVVVRFGDTTPHTPSMELACATAPYNVALTVAKAP